MSANHEFELQPWTLGYKAAEIAMRNGTVAPSYVWAEDSIKCDRHWMVPIARDLYQNNPVYIAIVDRLVTEVIGEDGVELKPSTGKAKIDARIKANWLRWCEFADYMGEDDFTELERRAFTEVVNVGEVLFQKVREERKLQMIETERIKSIKYDVTGAPESFEVAVKGKDPMILPAEDCIFLCLNKNRKTQGRGTGLLWSCFDVLQMILHILRSTAQSWGVNAKLAFAIETAPNLGITSFNQSDSDAIETDDRIVDMPNGMIVRLVKGEKVAPISHDGVPGANLYSNVLTFLRVVSSVCGFDAATVVFADFEKTNYSSSKSAVISLSKTVRRWQGWLKRRFYNRVYRWIAGADIVTDPMLRGKKEILDAADWIMPQPQIADAKGEAEANEKELTLGIATHDDIVLSRNKDPEELENNRLREIERKYAKAKDSEIVKAGDFTAEELTRVLAGLPISKTQMAEKAGGSDERTTQTDAA